MANANIFVENNLVHRFKHLYQSLCYIEIIYTNNIGYLNLFCSNINKLLYMPLLQACTFAINVEQMLQDPRIISMDIQHPQKCYVGG